MSIRTLISLPVHTPLVAHSEPCKGHRHVSIYRSLQGNAGDCESNCLLRLVDQSPVVPEADTDPGTQKRYDLESKHSQDILQGPVPLRESQASKVGLGQGSGSRSQEDEGEASGKVGHSPESLT